MFIVWRLKKNSERFYVVGSSEQEQVIQESEIEQRWEVRNFEDAKALLDSCKNNN